MQSAQWKYFGIFLFIVFVGNIAGLWVSQVLQQQQLAQLSSQLEHLEKGFKNFTSVPIQRIEPTDNQPTSSVSATPNSVNTSSKPTNDFEQRLKKVEDQLKTTTQASATTTTSSTTNNNEQNVKEYFVYLGSGSASSTEWTNIPGAVVTIDAGQYKQVKEVRFEAGLSVFSGNAYARLVNKDSGLVIYGTEVLHNTSTPTWKTSSNISLQSGSATYMVQLKSSSGELVTLSGARIKIVVN